MEHLEPAVMTLAVVAHVGVAAPIVGAIARVACRLVRRVDPAADSARRGASHEAEDCSGRIRRAEIIAVAPVPIVIAGTRSSDRDGGSSPSNRDHPDDGHSNCPSPAPADDSCASRRPPGGRCWCLQERCRRRLRQALSSWPVCRPQPDSPTERSAPHGRPTCSLRRRSIGSRRNTR